MVVAEPELAWAYEPDWAAAGVAFAELLLTWRHWTHRRVDVINFEDETVARRSVSVDFTQPSVPPPMRAQAGPMHIMPLARLRKRTLTNFDLVDEGNRSLPMLARDQHKELSTAALVAVARTVLGKLADDVAPECREVTTLPPPDALKALAGLLRVPALAATPQFVALGHALAESFVVAVPLPANTGERRIVKFSYDELLGDPNLTLSDALVRGSALRSKPLWFPVYAMGDVPSYHLEVIAPPGLQITRRELIVSDHPDTVERRRGPYRRAHFYHRPTASCRGHAAVNLRPQTSTIVRAAATVSLMTTLLLGVFWLAMLLGGFDERPGSAPSLLLFLPGAVSVLLVRSGEHALTIDMLWLLRVATLIAGGLAVCGGIAFAAFTGRPATTWVLGVLSALSVLPTAVLIVAWRRCDLGSDPDRRQTKAAHRF